MSQRTVSAVLTAIVLSWCSPGSMQAQAPLPMTASTTIGARSVAAQVHVSVVEGETHIRVEVGRSHADATVRGAASSAAVESVVTSGGRVVVVRGTGGGGPAAVFTLAGSTVRMVWSGRLELHGDPGERWADAVQIDDRTGDGVPDLIVGVVREGLAPCGAGPALLSPRALTATGALRSVELARSVAIEGPELDAVPTETASEPLVRALRFTGATSAAGSPDPWMASAPWALTDGNPATVWGEGRPGDGSGELLVGRWDSRQPLHALRFRAGAGVAMPTRIAIVTGEVARMVRLPPGAQDVTVRLDPPVLASCLTVVIDHGAAGRLATGFGEISGYTIFDGDAGLNAMVEQLVAESDDAPDLAGWLARLGEPACIALEGAWDRLGRSGRIWALRVGGASHNEAGLRLLARGGDDANAEVREIALQQLVEHHAFDALAMLAMGTGPGADEAALAFAATSGATVTPPSALFGSLEDGADREALRLAAARALLGAADGASEFIDGAGPHAAAAMAVALVDDRLGVSSREARHAYAARLIVRAGPAATEFVDRYRLVDAAAHLGPEERSEALLSFLVGQASGAEEWMLRDAALAALGRTADGDVLAHALADPYPRLRLRAVQVAAELEERATLETGLTDPWPQVRRAALLGLHDEPHAIAAMGDDVALVRVAAIELLTSLEARSAWASVEERFTDRDEWPEVIRAALAFVQRLCVGGAGAALAQIVRRGAREGAWAPDVELAIDALGVAFRLGGEAAAQARDAASSGGASVAEFEPVLSREASFERCE
jgi:hypothetical protein